MSVPDRLGDFEIVEEIGRGGFGIVYRAQQISLDRPVALKVLYRHLVHTEDQIARFEREARATARLSHPAIVSVFAWGEEHDSFYLAQRLVGSGRTLADELVEMRKEAEPPKGWFRRVAKMLASVADGLQQAHERGIVHRDVKPSNILLDESGEPFLSDFGLAKVEDGLQLSRTGDFAGSPYYMSPEQADSRRGPVNEQSDIYSLGVTMYEMLALALPFVGTNSHEIIRKIGFEEPRPPGRLQPRIPTDLETICLHAMEKNPLRRYPSAADFADDLRAFLQGEPISAVPVGSTRRLMRRMKRHRQAIGLVALGATVIVVGGWALGRERFHKASETVRSTTDEVVARGREQIDSEYDPLIEQAKQAGDVGKALELMETKGAERKQLDDLAQGLKEMVDKLVAEQNTAEMMEMAGRAGVALERTGGGSPWTGLLRLVGSVGSRSSETDVETGLDQLGRTPGVQPGDGEAMGVLAPTGKDSGR